MRTELVVVPSPALYFVSGVLQRHKPVHVQAFIPETSIERFDMRIVSWDAGSKMPKSTSLKHTQIYNLREMNSESLSILCRYAQPNLAPKTLVRYEELLKRILPAIGHIRLDKLQPHHLMAFYASLQNVENQSGVSFKATASLLSAFE